MKLRVPPRQCIPITGLLQVLAPGLECVDSDDKWPVGVAGTEKVQSFSRREEIAEQLGQFLCVPKI